LTEARKMNPPASTRMNSVHLRCRAPRTWLPTARRLTCALLFAAPAPSLAAAQQPSEELTAELFGGTAWSLPLPLGVHGGGDTRFTAHYSTRPFEDAPYYAYRLGRSSVGRAVELELVHHKLYLENPRPPVEDLQISHGYNLAMLNFVPRGRDWRWRYGVGIVVAHPEGRVAGRPVGPLATFLGGGYHIAGIASQIAVGRRYTLGNGDIAMTAAPELALSAAMARVRIDGGTLTVPNIALHALGGIGVRRRW
jgi:hypothetical protein